MMKSALRNSSPDFSRNRVGRFIVLAVMLFSAAAHAQLVNPTTGELAKLRDDVRSYMVENNIPGALIAVVSRGNVVHSQAFGLANVELQVPVTEESVFEIGSISKQFVSAAALLQAAEGKLNLDDSIHKHLPGLPDEWLGVTVRQLMNHTSGIPDYEEIRSYDVYRFRMTPEEVIRIAHSRPMDFAPGTGWYYSNTGYFILSMIVARVDGEPLGQVLSSRIFEPLGMTHTRLADPEAIIPNRVAGYWVNKAGELINRNPTETSSTLAAGGILSSLADLARWDVALYGTEMFSAETKRAMWAPAILPDGTNTEYALGWRVSPFGSLAAQSHGGQVAGFVAQFVRIPESDAAVIVFMNRYRVSSGYVRDLLLRTFLPLAAVPD